MFFFLSRDARDESNINVTLQRREIIFYINFTSDLFEFTFILQSWRLCSRTEQNVHARVEKKKEQKKKNNFWNRRLTAGHLVLFKTSQLPGILPEVDKEKRAGKFCGFASLTV